MNETLAVLLVIVGLVPVVILLNKHIDRKIEEDVRDYETRDL